MPLDFNKWQLYWRLSATSTLSGQNFFALGLPPPVTPVFKTYSTIVPQSLGGQTRQGYINATLLWDVLTREQAFTVFGIVQTVLAVEGAEVYATVDYNDGTYPPGSFVDIRGTPLPMILEPAGNSQGLIYPNVTLIINNCTVVNNPAVGV